MDKKHECWFVSFNDTEGDDMKTKILSTFSKFFSGFRLFQVSAAKKDEKKRKIRIAGFVALQHPLTQSSFHTVRGFIEQSTDQEMSVFAVPAETVPARLNDTLKKTEWCTGGNTVAPDLYVSAIIKKCDAGSADSTTAPSGAATSSNIDNGRNNGSIIIPIDTVGVSLWTHTNSIHILNTVTNTDNSDTNRTLIPVASCEPLYG
eukprot:GHVU01073988.1.p1 GENE.GHVU01073988.1~~GHVU01073988.1.p1  ORF type:complete len:204 (-),score=15.00 GHVU01073988.1:93-704(-)